MYLEIVQLSCSFLNNLKKTLIVWILVSCRLAWSVCYDTPYQGAPRGLGYTLRAGPSTTTLCPTSLGYTPNLHSNSAFCAI